MNQNTDRSRRPDPSRYDMYAAFRTKERAEKKSARPEGTHDIYDLSELKQKQDAARRRQQNRRQTEKQQRRQESASAIPQQPEHRRTDFRNPKNTYGIRIQPVRQEDDQPRHSSYITSDGRILDGFDKTGRPIYRSRTASGTIVQKEEFGLTEASEIPEVQSYKIKTLANTETKPFPFGILLTVLFCTAMVMGVLYSYMKLNEYTNELSYLNYQLGNLRADTNTLSAEVVRREDLISIEQTASETLGMVKNDILTKKYVSIENEDKTELVSKEEKKEKIRTSVEIDLTTGRPVTEARTDVTSEKDPSVPSAKEDSDS